MLTKLIASEIDPNPDVRGLLVSALLIGGNVTVPTGQDVGGDFQNFPACRSASQTGCVVAYSSFIEPPPADTVFGKVEVGPKSWEPRKPMRIYRCCASIQLRFQGERARCRPTSRPFRLPGLFGV